MAAACAFCAAIVYIRGRELEGTEFSGGSLTGPLLQLNDAGALFFILGLLLTFALQRIAAVTVLLGCLLCLPLCVYFTAPGPYRRLFPGNYSVPLSASFVWDSWSITAMIVLALATSTAIAVLRHPRSRASL